MTETERLTRIATRMARRFGAMASVYAGATSFDVLTERRCTDPNTGVVTHDGLRWIKSKTTDAYRNPASVARRIRREMKATWA